MRDKIRLGDVCTVVSGTTPKTGNEEYWDGDILWVTPAELTDDTFILNDTARKITQKAVKDSSLKPFPKGTVLLSSRAPIGKVAIAGQEMYCNQGFKNFICNERLNNEYLYWFLKGKKDFLNSLGRGATFKEVSKSIVENIEIPLFDIVEQKHIASLMNTCQSIITLKKRHLNELDVLIKSRFVEVFGECGEEVPLTDYVWFQEGPGVRSVDFRTEGCILLTGSNINDNEISFGYNSDRFISDELAEGKYSHFICDEGDILVVTSAIAPDKFDKKVVVLESEHKYCLNTGIIRFKPNYEHLTNGYFREFLKSMYFKRQVMSEMRGIAQMHFGPSHLKNMTILLPDSLEKQIEFEKFVQHVDKLKFEVQKSLNETQMLFDSLMQEYFE